LRWHTNARVCKYGKTKAALKKIAPVRTSAFEKANESTKDELKAIGEKVGSIDSALSDKEANALVGYADVAWVLQNCASNSNS
jgi:hypothetical protein